MKSENPKVSVIISVYNTEHFLRKCMNSLVYQTLDGIEIIAINNGSTDDCEAILEDYLSRYPKMIRVITLEKNTGNPAEPWNIGIDLARGEFISIVDSDDWCEHTMFESLYQAALEYDAEVVICDHFEVLGKDNYIRSKINEERGEFSVKRLVMYPHMAPWGKIIRRDIYTKNNFKYRNQIHCDTGLNLILYSYLNKVAYIDEPLYYYNRINPNSETNTKKRMKQAKITETLDYILDNYNKKWENEVVFSVTKFLYWFCFFEYIFHQDIFVPFIKKHEREIRRNKYLKDNREGLRVVFDYLDRELVPKRIIYNTFGKKQLSKLEINCIESWKKYTEDYIFLELNEENCDIDCNPYIRQMYDDGEIDIVANYFMLRELYEEGGIVLNTTMMMNGPIGELRMHKLTLGFDSADTIGDHIIACVKKLPVIRQLCEHILLLNEFGAEATDDEAEFWHIAEDEREEISPVSKFFYNYCSERVEQGCSLLNRNIILKNDIALLSSDRLYYNINNQINIFFRVYPEAYFSVKKPFLLLHENACKSYVTYIQSLEQNCRSLSYELTELKNSRSWRIMAPVRSIARIFRSFKAKLWSLIKHQESVEQ